MRETLESQGIDRAELSRRAFENSAVLRRLEEILHPIVRAEEAAFLRLHRGILVNVERVRERRRADQDDAVLFRPQGDSTVSYRGVTYMEQPEFCGKVCHSVMEPEYVSYINSPHARVACTQCHVGPGAGASIRPSAAGPNPHPLPLPSRQSSPARQAARSPYRPG